MAKGEGKGGVLVSCIVCISVLFGGLVALVAFVALALSIWHCVDLFVTNDELLYLANDALGNKDLEIAYIMFICCGILAQLLSCVAGKNKTSGDEGNKCSSIFGVIFTLLLIAGHLTSGIMGLLYKENRIPDLPEKMLDLLENDVYMNATDLSSIEYTNIGQYYNFMQTKYECCGVNKNDGQDYRDAKFEDKYGIPFPYSCCVLKDRKETDWRNIQEKDVRDWEKCKNLDYDNIYQYACHRTLRDFLQAKSNFIIGFNFALVILCAATFILLLIVLCCSLCCG